MSHQEATYDIDPERVRKNRHSHREFIWFHEFITTARQQQWRYVPCSSSKPDSSLVTLSDNEKCSLIQLECPGIEFLNEKQHFTRLCRKEPWTPEAIVIKIDSQGHLTESSSRAVQRWPIERYTLLFLKKAGYGIGGGYDVNPIVVAKPHEKNLTRVIEERIALMNTHPAYRRNIFILQAGIENPVLTPRGQKLDLRLYMLIVGDMQQRYGFYACRIGDVRNTLAGPYDPYSEDIKLQVTNITQNSRFLQEGETSEAVTHLFSPETTPWYEKVFSQFLNIARRIAVIYSPIIVLSTESYLPSVTLLGLDAVIDSRTMAPMIVELNRRPTVYSPDVARKMKYSSAYFMRDVFEIGIEEGILNLPRKSSSRRRRQFILVHRTRAPQQQPTQEPPSGRYDIPDMHQQQRLDSSVSSHD